MVLKQHIALIGRWALGFGVLGVACKLGSILGGNYYWPVWPNIIDVLTLMGAGAFICLRGKR